MVAIWKVDNLTLSLTIEPALFSIITGEKHLVGVELPFKNVILTLYHRAAKFFLI